MRFLHRYLSEELTNEALCKFDCLKDLKTIGTCSSYCLDKCPSICEIVGVTVFPPPPETNHHNNLKKILLISASSTIATLFLLALLLLCFQFYNKRRSISISRRSSMEEARRNWEFDEPSQVIIDHPVWHIRTIGLNPTVISSIKVCKYSKKDGVVEGTDCSVCLSEFEEEETLRLLPKCKHAFHLYCIDTWLRSHTNCPLCRAPIVTIGDQSEDQEETHVMIQEESGDDIEEEIEEERDEFGSDVRDHGESQNRVRRSVSLNSLSGLREKEKLKRSNVGSSIVGRSSFLKRSISYSGK